MSYGCSFFHMHRDGLYDEYKSHEISNAQEKEWKIEFRSIALAKFEDNPTEEVHSCYRYLDTIDFDTEEDCIDSIIDSIKRRKGSMDSFSKLLVSEQLCDTLQSNKIDRVRLKKIKSLSQSLLHDVIKEPANIDAYYKNLGYLRDKLGEPDITDRASKALEQINQLRTSRWSQFLSRSALQS